MIVDLQLVLADGPTIYTNKEVCGDGIDNNVNGKIDDGCPDHPSIANTPHKIKTIYRWSEALEHALPAQYLVSIL